MSGYEPVRDPERDHPPKLRKAPEALGRLQELFTCDKQLATFRWAFGRDPNNDGELDAFAEEYVLELYNSGYDEI